MDAFMAPDPSLKGQMHIVRLKRNEDAEPYTIEEMCTLRYILINDGRGDALQKAFSFATGGQGGNDMMMFNTTDGNELIFGIPGEVKKALKKPTKPERFDTLLALTYALKDNDHWMHDNEC